MTAPRLAGAGDELRRRQALKRPSTTAAPTGGDLAGTEVVATERVPLGSIARHPLNPRGQVDPDAQSVGELAANMQEVGILQPLVVVSRAAFAAARPDEALPDGALWVLVAGERRLAAAKLADLTTAPVVVRDNLIEDGLDIEAMIAENVQREDLTPLQEARAYRLLVDRGDSQRVIAKRMGRGQSHITKRLALLKLPQEAQDAITDEKIGLKQAETLAVSVPADDIAAVWTAAQTMLSGELGDRVRAAITRYQTQKDAASRYRKAEKKARAQAIEEDITILTDDDLDGVHPGNLRAWRDEDVEAARTSGTLAGYLDRDGELIYIDTATKDAAQDFERRHQNHEAERASQERERKTAAKARRAVAAAMLSVKPTTTQLVDELATTVLRQANHETLRIAAKLAPGDSMESLTHSQWRDAALTGAPAQRITAARAVGIARLETAVSADWGTWDAEQVAYVDRLVDAGYTEGPYEQRKRASARSAETDAAGPADGDTDNDEDTQ